MIADPINTVVPYQESDLRALNLGFTAPSTIRSLITPTSMRQIWGRSHETCEQLLQVYFPILEKSFGDPNEIGSIAKALRAFARPIDWDIDILFDTISESMVGGIHWRTLQPDVIEPTIGPSRLGVIEHIWNTSHCGRLHHDMLLERMSASGAKAVIIEVNDPDQMTAEQIAMDAKSGISPRDRIKWWMSRGYQMLDAPYIQAAIHPDSQPVRGLKLGIKFLNGTPESVSRDWYLSVVKSYFAAFLHGTDIATEPTFCEIGALLSEGRVAILPLDTVRK